MKDANSANQPLKGIRALEWGAFHAGPGSLAILGDLGAEVIKIELPKTGDPIRMLVRFGNFPVAKGGHSLFYEGANRHKKSIALDLSKEEGKQIVYRLVSKCDIFTTNFRVNAVENQRMTYAHLREFNPRLIYASVSAFGSKGPDREAGGFDFLGQARSGLMVCAGEPDMPPLIAQFGLIDQITAITTSHAILTALYARERTGVGQEVKVSLLSSAMFLQYFNVLNALIMEADVPRHQQKSTDPLRNFYKCRDGKYICMTVAHHPSAWKQFCLAIDHPELEHDSRFENRDTRFANRNDFIAFLDTVFITKTRDEWFRILSEHDVFCSPVNAATETVKDPQTTANDYVIDINNHRLFGNIKVPGYPVEFSETPANPGFTAPKLGEHTREILRDLGGYSEAEILKFKQDKVVDWVG